MAGTRMAVRGAESRATAQKLIALSKNPAQHEQSCSVALESGCKEVQRCRMQKDGIVAGIQMYAGQVFYIVKSEKLFFRGYIVTCMNGIYRCSAPCLTTRIKMVNKAKEYKASLVTAAIVAEIESMVA